MDPTLFNFLITTVMTTGATLRGMLMPMAMPLLGALLTLVLTWTLVKHFLGDGFVETIVTAMQTVFVAGFVAVLLLGWTTKLQGTHFSVADFFVGGMNEVSTSVQGNQNITAVFNTILKTTMGMGTTAVETCNDEITGFDANGMSTGEMSQVCRQTTSDSASLWSFKSMLNFGDFLAAIILRLVAVVIVMITFIFYECVLLLSIVYVDIGLILGPILVPFLIWKPTSFLFDGWLRMMISGGMYKIVASIILVYVGAVFGAFNTVDTKPLEEGQFNSHVQSAISFSIMLVAGAGLYLMMQVQSIVGTIVGGGGIDMSPRLGRLAGSAARMASGASKMVSSMKSTSTTTPAVKPTSTRLGAGGQGMGRSNPAAVRSRSDRTNGAFGRGRSSPERRPMNQK